MYLNWRADLFSRYNKLSLVGFILGIFVVLSG